MNRKEFVVLVGILLIAFILRIFHLNELRLNYPYFYEELVGTDMRTYVLAAKELAEGNTNPKSLLADTPLYIYKYFLGILYKMIGPSADKVRFAQIILLGLPVIIMVYFIGRILFNTTIGLLSASLAGIYGVFILYESVFLSEMLWTFFSCATLLSLALFTKKKKKVFIVLAGVSLGLATLSRPNIVLVMFGIIIWIFYSFNFKLLRKILLSIICLASFFSVFLVFSILHYLVYDTLSFSTPGALTFCMGNNKYARGWFQYPPHMDELKVRAKQLNLSLDEVMLRDCFDFIKEEPIKWFCLFVKKIFLFWDDWEMPNNIDYDQIKKDYSRVLRLPFILSFGVIAPLALGGMLLNLKKNRKKLSFLYLYIAFFALSIVIIFVCGRYRVPVAPALIIFASSFIYQLYKKIIYRKYKTVIFWLIIFSLLYLFCNSRLIASWAIPLIKPTGIYELIKDKELIIRYDTDNWRGGRGVSIKNNQYIQKVFILEGIRKKEIKDAYIRLTLAADSPDGFLIVKVNNSIVHKLPCLQLPHKGLVGSGSLPFPTELLKIGKNIIQLETKGNGSVFMPIDDYYRYGKSFYYDGRSLKKIKGELRLQLQLVFI